jgi:hypothetical protein
MTKLDPRLLEKAWVHAHEEDAPGRKVFRPASHPLPPSRGRVGYEFKAGGKLIRSGPGATDRPEKSEGTWTLSAGGRLTMSVAGSDQVLDVVGLEPDRLLIKT